MIDHVWSVLCSHALVDAETHQVTLYATLDEVGAAQPSAPGAGANGGLSFEVVSLWVRSNPYIRAAGKARLTIAPPSGAARELGELAIDLADAERVRTRFVFDAFMPMEAGRYMLVVEHLVEGEAAWQPAARIPLTVHWQPA